MNARRAPHYHVYVVELDDRVWNEPSFRRANPDYLLGQPYFYVGMTGLDPDIRFDRHTAGVQANRFVRDYGLRLRRTIFSLPVPQGWEYDRFWALGMSFNERDIASFHVPMLLHGD